MLRDMLRPPPIRMSRLIQYSLSTVGLLPVLLIYLSMLVGGACSRCEAGVGDIHEVQTRSLYDRYRGDGRARGRGRGSDGGHGVSTEEAIRGSQRRGGGRRRQGEVQVEGGQI